MASDHWRDLHREQGRFKARPGAKGFLPVDLTKKPTPGPMRLWIARVRGGEKPVSK